MTAPTGAIVSLYVDLVEQVCEGDVIETQTGRRYGVLAVRVQARGKAKGRQHLRCVVFGEQPEPEVRFKGAPDFDGGTVHKIRWYARPRSKR